MSVQNKSKWENRSITYTIFLSMLLVALVPLLIMAIQGYHCASMAVVQLQSSHLDSVLHARKSRIVDWLNDRNNDIATIAAAPCTKFVCREITSGRGDVEKRKICALLDQSHQQEPAYESLVLYSANWKRLETSKQTVHNDKELLSSNFKEKLMTATNAIVASPHIHDNGVVAIHIGIPVFEDEMRVGYVVAALDLSIRLYSILEDRAGFGKTTRTYMLYQGGHYLSMSDHNMEMQEEMVLPPLAIREGTNGKAEFYKNCKGMDVIGVSSSINDLNWMLVAEIDKKEAFAWLYSLRLRAAVTGVIALMLVVLMSMKYSRKITSPLLKLAKVANQISDGNFDKRLPPLKGKEPKDVAVAFNSMLDELEKVQTALVQTAALAAVGELTSSIVHEMRNPLSSVKMNLTALQKKVADDEVYSELSEIAIEQAGRLEQMLYDLLQYGKTVELNWQLLTFGGGMLL